MSVYALPAEMNFVIAIVVGMNLDVLLYVIDIKVGRTRMIDFKENLENGLCCSIDWLSFTITAHKSIGEVLGLFGFSFADFYECEKGAMGYKRMLMLHGSNLRVMFEGNDNMGIHFDVSGSAMADLYEYYKRGVSEVTPWDTLAVDIDMQIVSHMLGRVLQYGHVTRLDLAIDNKGDIYYRLPELVAVLENHRFVTKFRKWRNVAEKETSGQAVGHTVYFGSRSSNVMLRVYDKQLEQNSKHRDDVAPIEYEWVRWELELKGERAQMAVEHMLDGFSVGEVCVGVLANYFRVIIFDDSNKSRCSNDIKWDTFINNIRALRLYVHHEEKTLEDKKNWIMRQVAPTLTGIIIANYGDISFLTQHLELQSGRMKRGLRDLVTQANPGWEESLRMFSEGSVNL